MSPKLLSIINKINPNLKEDQLKPLHNCWGFTSLLLGWDSQPRWLKIHLMEARLIEYTIHIDEKDRKPKDIVVFRDDRGMLVHTALLLSPRRVLHKDGHYPIEISLIKDVRYKPHNIEYRRLLCQNSS